MNSKIWGTYTWIFFHTLADKIKEEEFENNKNKFINMIINICNYLPCPDCSEDATYILRQSYLNNIKTKKHFIEFLRQFHNIVNIKIGKKEMLRSELIDLYKDKDFDIIFLNMINIYKNIRTSERLMIHNFHRNQFLNKLVVDFNNIKHLLHN